MEDMMLEYEINEEGWLDLTEVFLNSYAYPETFPEDDPSEEPSEEE